MVPEDNSLEQGYEGSTYDSSLEMGAPVTTTSVSATGSGFGHKRLSPFRYNKLAFMVTGVALAAILIIGGGSVLFSTLRGNKTNQGTVQKADQYSVGSLPLSGVQGNAQLKVGEVNQLDVNGQLQVSKTLVITPTSAPTTPTLGQFYFDKATNSPYYYNGTTFVNLAPQYVTSIGGSSGSFSIGSGLSVVNNTINNTGVTSIQGQSGDVNFASGSGIKVNGTTISNTGILSVSGTPNQIGVTNNNGDVQVRLLGAEDGGVIIGSGGGLATIKPTAVGQCLISDSSSLPVFGSCTGASTVQSIQVGSSTLSGALTLQATGGLAVSSSGNTITVDGSGIVSGGDVSFGTTHNAGFVTALDNSGKLISTVLANQNGGLQAATSAYYLDLANAGTSTFTVKNSNGSNVANLAVTGTVQSKGLLDAAGNLYGFATTPSGSSRTLCYVDNTNASNCPAGGNVSYGATHTSNTIAALDGSGNLINSSLNVVAGGLQVVSSNYSLDVKDANNSTLTVKNSTSGKAANLVVTGTISAAGLLNGSDTFTLPTNGGSGGVLCYVSGGTSNCPTGGNVATTGTPTNGNLAVFTGTNTIGNSIISDNGSTVSIGGNLSANAITAQSLQSAGALTISAAGSLTVGTTSQVLALQGNASSTMVISSNGHTMTVGFTPLTTSDRTIVFSNESGTVCLQNSNNCGFAAAGSGVTSLNTLAGALTLNNATGSGSAITIDNASTSAKGIASFNATDFSVASGVVSTIQAINTTAAVQFGSLTLGAGGNLNISPTGTLFADTIKTTPSGSGNLSISSDGAGSNITFAINGGTDTFTFPTGYGPGQQICTTMSGCASGTGNAVILEPQSGAQSATSSRSAIFINRTTGGGNLIQLQAGGTDAFVIDASGNTTIANTVHATGNVTVDGTLTANTIASTGALTIGSSSKQFVLQGNASSTLSATSGSNTTTVGFTTPTGNNSILFPDYSGTVCLSQPINNCGFAAGGSGISGSGTSGKIAKFTGAGAIGDSLLSESGSVVTVGGSLAVGVASSVDGTVVVRNAANANMITIQAAAAPSSNLTLKLPTQSGTFAVAATGPLSLDPNTGQLSCATCLTSGGGGGSAGVSSVNSLTGALTINNSSGSGTAITLDNAAADGVTKGIATFNSTNFSASGGVINLVQDIATTSSPTFANLSLQGATGLTVGSASNLGQILFKDGTNDGFTSTFRSATLSANQVLTIPNATGTLAVSASGNLSLSALGALSITNSPTFSTSVTTPLLQSTGALSITPGGALTIGSTGQSLALQGNGSTTLSATVGANKTTVGFTTPTAARSILFPDYSGTVCLSAPANNCNFAAGGSGVTSLNTLTGALTVANASTAGSTITLNDAAADGTTKGIATFNSSNFSASGGVVNTVQNIGTGASPTFTGLTVSGLGTGVVQSTSGVLSAGTIGVANGGTGATTLTLNGILYGNGTSAIQATSAAANSILATNGSNVPGLTQTLPTAVQGNITSTGALAGGSIASGFGTISTGNNITTSATVQGGTVNATSAINLNGTSINTAGTLSNVAYLNQANSFSAANTFTSSIAVQGGASVTTASGIALTVQGAAGSDIVNFNKSDTTTALKVASSGLVTANYGVTITSGLTASGLVQLNPSSNANTTINSGTSTGTVSIGNSVAGAIGITSGSTINLQGTGGVSVTSGNLTLGVASTTSGTLTFASSSSTNKILLQGSAPSGSGNATLQIPTLAAGSTYTICYLDGSGGSNCSGAGGGVTTTTGASNYVARFTGATTLGIGQLLDNGSAVYVGNTGASGGGLFNVGSSNQFQVSSGGAVTASSLTTGGSVGTAATSTSSTNSAALILQSGNASGTTSNSGNVTLDSGTATGTAGSVSVGTGAYAHNVTVGNTTGTSTLTLQGGTNGILLSPAGGSTNVGVRVKPVADTTLALQVQNAAGTANLLVVDSTNSMVGIGAAPSSSGSLLQVGTNTTTSTGGLQFGTDAGATIYRSGTSALTVGGALTTLGSLAVQSSAGLSVGNGGVSGVQGKITLYNGQSSASAHSVSIVAASTQANDIALTIPVDSNATDFLCLQQLGNCGGTLQADYTASTGGATPEIVLDSTRGGVDIQNNASGGVSGNSLFAVRDKAANNTTLGSAMFSVSDTGAALFKNSANSTTAFQVQNSNGVNLLSGDTSTQTLNVGLTPTAVFANETTTVAAVTSTNALATGDFNKDGKADAIVPINSTNSAVILNGSSSGSTGFSGSTTITICGSGATGAATGDINGDGWTDAVVTCASSAWVFMNNGSGTLNAGAALSGLSAPTGVATGDINKDGKADIIITQSGTNNAYVYNGVGSGTPTLTTTLTSTNGLSGPTGVATGDFNNDTYTDVVIGNSGTNVTVFLSNGTTLNTTAVSLTGALGSTIVATGDINADGKADVAATSPSGFGTAYYLNAATAGAQTGYLGLTSSSGVTMADFNADGKADVAISNYSGGAGRTISVYYGGASGPSATAAATLTSSTALAQVASGDFNGDGKPDVALAHGSANGTISTFINTFTLSGSLKVGAAATFSNTLAINPALDGTSILSVQNAGGTGLLNVDTTNMRVSVGTRGTATGQLYVSGQMPTGPLASAGGQAASYGLAINGRYAYITPTGATKGLQVFDISNPSSPTQVGNGVTTTASTSKRVKVVGKYAYIASSGSSGTGYLQVFDISNPAVPVQMAAGTSFTAGTGTPALYVQGRYAYVGDASPSSPFVYVYDVSNPANITRVGSVAVGTTGNGAVDMYAQGRYLYVANSSTNTTAFQVVDISNPLSPSVVGSSAVTGTPLSVVAQGRYAYVGTTTTLNVIDVSTAASPSTASTVSLGGHADSLSAQGRYVYAGDATTNGSGVIRAIDVSVPSSPSLMSGTATGQSPLAMVAAGRYLYTSNNNATTNTLQVYDLGGEYAQQLEAGGLEADTLNVRSNANFASDVSVQGSLGVGGGLQVTGDSGFSGQLTATGQVAFKNATNSTTAFQVQNANGANILTADSTNLAVKVGTNAINATFATKVDSTIPSGAGPYDIATGDFNGDGKADAITANYNTGSATMFAGNSTGLTTPGTALTSGANSWAAAAGDFNGDGKMDAVVLNVGGTANVSVYMNNGSGLPPSPTASFNTDVAPTAIITADINKDGKADAIVTGATNGTVRTYLGTSSGLTNATVYTQSLATGASPQSVVAGDFNNDGNPDIVVSNGSVASAFFYPGNGTSLGASSSLTTGGGPFRLVAGDFNGDGKTDFACANNSSNTVSIFYNNGSGTPGSAGAASKTITVTGGGSSPFGIAAGDFDGDGITDLVVPQYSSNSGTTAQVIMNPAATSPTQITVTTNTGPLAAATGDFNGDGKTDIAITNYNNQAGTKVSVFLNTSIQASLSVTGNQQISTNSSSALTVKNGSGITFLNADTASNILNVNGSAIFKNQANSTTAFQIQNASGTALFTADTSGGGITIGGILTVTGSASLTGGLTVTGASTFNGHLITANSSGSTTFAGTSGAGAVCTSAPTVSGSSGNDTSGTIVIDTTPGGCAASDGTTVTVTFANSYGSAPTVLVDPANGNAADRQTYVDTANTSTASFKLSIKNGLSNTTTYKFYYHVLQ